MLVSASRNCHREIKQEANLLDDFVELLNEVRSIWRVRPCPAHQLNICDQAAKIMSNVVCDSIDHLAGQDERLLLHSVREQNLNLCWDVYGISRVLPLSFQVARVIPRFI